MATGESMACLNHLLCIAAKPCAKLDANGVDWYRLVGEAAPALESRHDHGLPTRAAPATQQLSGRARPAPWTSNTSTPSARCSPT
jgi:hypothetical protein